VPPPVLLAFQADDLTGPPSGPGCPTYPLPEAFLADRTVRLFEVGQLPSRPERVSRFLGLACRTLSDSGVPGLPLCF